MWTTCKLKCHGVICLPFNFGLVVLQKLSCAAEKPNNDRHLSNERPHVRQQTIEPKAPYRELTARKSATSIAAGARPLTFEVAPHPASVTKLPKVIEASLDKAAARRCTSNWLCKPSQPLTSIATKQHEVRLNLWSDLAARVLNCF